LHHARLLHSHAHLSRHTTHHSWLLHPHHTGLLHAHHRLLHTHAAHHSRLLHSSHHAHTTHHLHLRCHVLLGHHTRSMLLELIHQLSTVSRTIGVHKTLLSLLGHGLFLLKLLCLLLLLLQLLLHSCCVGITLSLCCFQFLLFRSKFGLLGS
jgi:hypothetical protein